MPELTLRAPEFVTSPSCQARLALDEPLVTGTPSPRHGWIRYLSAPSFFNLRTPESGPWVVVWHVTGEGFRSPFEGTTDYWSEAEELSPQSTPTGSSVAAVLEQGLRVIHELSFLDADPVASREMDLAIQRIKSRRTVQDLTVDGDK